MSQRLVENTIPVLAVRDLDRSIEFFGRVLEFEVEWRAGGTCSVGRDGNSIMLQALTHPMPSTVWVGLGSDTLIENAPRSGAEVLLAPTNSPWAYEMKVADPDGNTIWLGAAPRPE